MRPLVEREVVIQVWSEKDPDGARLLELVQVVMEHLKDHPELGSFVELEGPTAHIPDYFSELCGSVLGWLIYVANADPIKLKRLVLSLEQNGSKRLADIDIFTSYFDKISRRGLG